MKIIFTSDLHGNKNAYKRFSILLKDCDLGILGGDLSAFFGARRAESEIRQILDSAGKAVLFIMGNMDRYEWNDGGNIRNINQRSITIRNQGFAGYQFTTPFSGGPFEKPENLIKSDLEQMEKMVDSSVIFISHGPPHGILDRTGHGVSAGSVSIREFTGRTKPVFHLFGHIHEAAGINGNCINGAFPKLGKFVLIDSIKKTIDLIK